MKTVTLKAIRAHKPCVESWEKLLSSLGKTRADDTKVSIEYILDLLGLDDALWALRALPESQDSSIRLLLCDLVEPALQYTDDPRPAEAVRVAREYAFGNATSDSLEAAWAAARDAARAAARVAARDAATASAASAHASAIAARAAAAGAAAAARAAAGAASRAAAGAVTKYEARDEARQAALVAAWDAARDAAGRDQERIFRDWLRSES